MTVRDIELKLLYPSVEFVAYGDGTVRATLDASRVTSRGTLERYTIILDDLDVNAVACVGRGARIAIHYARNKVQQRMDAAYNRVITPGS